MIWLGAITPTHAGDHAQVYEVVRDERGRWVGTVECDDITTLCIIRDTRGRRTTAFEVGSEMKAGGIIKVPLEKHSVAVEEE